MSDLDKKINDEQLEMLLVADHQNEPALTPPEGLLERLVADIPEDLGLEWQQEEAEAAPEREDVEAAPEISIPFPANDVGSRYWRWAVAATVMMAIGVGAIMLRHFQPAGLTGVPESQFQASSEAEIREEADSKLSKKEAFRVLQAASSSTEGRVDQDAQEPNRPLASASEAVQQQRGVAPAPQESLALGELGARDEAFPSVKRNLSSTESKDDRSDASSRQAGEGLKPRQRSTASRAAERPAVAPRPKPKSPQPLPPPSPQARRFDSQSDSVAALDGEEHSVADLSAHVLRDAASEKSELKPQESGQQLDDSGEMIRGELIDEITVIGEAPLVTSETRSSSMAVTVTVAATAADQVVGGTPSDGERAEGELEDSGRLATLGYSQVMLSKVNDEAFADNYFEVEDTNPFIDTEDDSLSTFGLDVDTGSYGVVREYLRRGHLPPRGAVRVEEMLNYFDYRSSPPGEGEGDFALSADGGPSIYGEGERYYLLRVGVKGREVSAEDRPPALLTFVVDVSGSMQRDDRLGLVKQSLSLLLDQLRQKDRMALVVYGDRGRVVLEPTSDRERIRHAIESLRAEGATNAGEGLDLAYAMAARSRRHGEINRVILCSDGVANVGRTSAASILESVRKHANEGVELTTVGFGMGNYNDVLMEQLADRGNGRYAYVDTLLEARHLFVENLAGTLQTIAAEARSQVQLNPELVARYRLLGYENRDIADDRFRDDTVDAGEIGAGHTVTALYELKTKRALRRKDRVATVHLRYASIVRGEMVEQSIEVRGRDFAKTWEATPESFRLAALVAEWAEVLRGSYWARNADPRDVFVRLQKVAAEFPGDTKIAELAMLAGKTAELIDIERKAREKGSGKVP